MLTRTQPSSRNTQPRNLGVSNALRAGGYVQLPPLWIPAHEMPNIHQIAHRYQDEVNQVRAEVCGETYQNAPDPREDKDAAWAAFEAARSA